jgi:catechol 2,3-dioxygenase-like lactoylglutathione lyase family enzyme
MEFNKLVPELSVSNFEKSLDFYTRVLGFKVEYDRREEGFAFLSINGAQLMIEQMNNHWVTGSFEYPLGRGVSFQIEVVAIEPMFVRLNAEAIPLFREPKECWRKPGDEETGEIEFLVMDPDGYLLRFSEFLGVRPI